MMTMMMADDISLIINEPLYLFILTRLFIDCLLYEMSRLLFKLSANNAD
jgi:hypothetical protein